MLKNPAELLKAADEPSIQTLWDITKSLARTVTWGVRVWLLTLVGAFSYGVYAQTRDNDISQVKRLASSLEDRVKVQEIANSEIKSRLELLKQQIDYTKDRVDEMRGDVKELVRRGR